LSLTTLLAASFPRPDFAGWIESASGPWIYAIAGLLTFAETATLLFFIPGEITLIVAGVTAGAGDVNLVALLIVANVAAIGGDAVGFWIGRRFGPKLATSRLGAKLGEDNWRKAEALIHNRKGLIVLVGRWIGFLRAIMPATAGMSGMNYKRDFLPYDVVGASSWATLCVLGGWKLGERAEDLVHYIGYIAAGVAVIGVAFFLIKRRVKRAAT
jgi:membrane protein DedA with SNARE-associated domain